MKNSLFVITTVAALAACSGSSGTTGATTGATGSSGTTSASSTTSGTNAATTSGVSGTTHGATTASSTTSGTATATTSGSATATTSGVASGTTSGTTATTTSGFATTSGVSGFSTTLLVDNDAHTPPDGSGDGSLALFQPWLTGITPALSISNYAEPTGGTPDTNDPTAKALVPVDNVIWFTADYYGGNETVSDAQASALVSWLALGGKTLVLFTTGLVYDRSEGGWAGPETDGLMSLFAQGAIDDPNIWSAAGDNEIEQDANPVIVSGGTNAAFMGKGWQVLAGQSAAQYSGYSVSFYWGPVNPAAGVDVLATIQADPTNTGTANMTTAVIVGVKNVVINGTATTSTIVYVGLPVENINNGAIGASSNTLSDLYTAIQTYAGL